MVLREGEFSFQLLHLIMKDLRSGLIMFSNYYILDSHNVAVANRRMKHRQKKIGLRISPLLI